ncbi:uncharacterized protein LOC122664844 [Telopea speciosissima]|uniref:uncharacterized protein LOC122664844 n=1 Tax=Telopea speciosissima TaxID=54955 RepID=UPI001CC52E39|nr:uncharacterized protein LOC122664844 [Telopea speciosissima]
MQIPCLDACKNFTSSQSFLGFRNRDLSSFSSSLVVFSDRKPSRGFSCSFNGGKGKPRGGVKPRKDGGGHRMKVKEKDNVWSVDNKLAKDAEMAEKDKLSRRRRKGRRVKNFGKRNTSSRVMVSEAMLMEVETVLQTQEPVIKPAWNTFASSVSGIWKGVGAVFSPITAAMEPIEVGNQNEYLYDCYTLSRIESVPSSSGGRHSQIRRKINWVTLNPHGEIQQQAGGSSRRTEAGRVRDGSSSMKEAVDMSGFNHDLSAFESFDFGTSDMMEEDFMGMEPGLVFFEDGSYSRGPVHVPVGEVDDSTYFLSPTFKFEQCLVKGCHKRLRIVHTVEFSNGGSDIQILRVAVYEEQWITPAALDYQSDDPELELKPFSQRKRTQPSDLTGPWKVFEVSATPIFGDDTVIEEGNGVPYVYLCTETVKKRSLPENPVYFGEEEMLDMQDVTVLWLPGGVTGYVDIKKDGILCIGVGWYSEEGLNLVMERDYGMDGMLKDVRWKSEVKRRWSDPLPV